VETTFADVAGCDEVKDELVEVIAFLKNPEKFQKLGGRIPKGVPQWQKCGDFILVANEKPILPMVSRMNNSDKILTFVFILNLEEILIESYDQCVT